MDRVFSDDAHQREFERQGFLRLPLLPPSQVGELLDAVLALRSATVAGESCTVGLEQSFCTTNADYRRSADALVSRYVREPLLSLLEGYRLVASGVMIKQPGAQAGLLHRDSTTVVELDTVVLDVWCPLVDMTDDFGNLALLPGTHTLPNIEAFGTPRFYSPYADALKKLSVSYPLQAGEALIFDHRLLHWGRENRCPAPRPVVRAVAAPAASRMVCFRPESASAGRRFEIVDAEADGAVAHSPEAVAAGEVALPTLGYIDNPNRAVSYKECRAAIARASGRVPLAARQVKSIFANLH